MIEINILKPLKRMNFRRLQCQAAIYTSNKRSMSVIIRYTSAVSFLLPFVLLSTQIHCPWKCREGGKIRPMEHLFIVSSTDIERCKRMHLVIIYYVSPVFTLGVCDTPASTVKHPLFPLCVHFEIVLDNPFGVVILFYPLPSANFRYSPV